MKFVRTLLSASVLFALLGMCCPQAHALDDVVITEFMAENDNTLADEDGDFSDWIEIFNAGTNMVNLSGWSLTDTQSRPGWHFPATNLPINSFIVVFASAKDRRIPGRELHTDFKLNNSGEYLALLKPDGTVQSSYAPVFPLQVPGISYGIPVTLSTTTLLTTGAAGKFTVPLNDQLGLDWTQPGFSDGSWVSVNNGVGFEADPPPSGAPAVIADSMTEFSGTQGGNGWFYGYWDKKSDINGTYEPGDFILFPRGTGNILAGTNFWNGSKWDFPATDPSRVELTASGGQPTAENGNLNLPVQWAIRRYVSETNGPLRITGILACQSLNGASGDGIIGRIFVDGVEVFQRVVKFSSEGYSIVVSANLGSTIDFVIDAGNASDDFSDATTFTAKILTTGGATVVADTLSDWSVSGTQGENNWTYGYFNATTGGVYATTKFVPFPSGTGPQSSGNFWNGEAWKWFGGDPPFDTIGQIETRPSVFTTGGVNANQHWVIRRWISEVSGTIHVDWHIAKKDLTGTGVTGSVYQNGTSRDTFNLTAADFVGTNRTIVINGVQVGDAIDLVIAPGADVIGDICFFNATIHGSGTLAGQFASNVGNLMTNINSSAYLRLPFTVADVRTINGLTLRMKYDDGFAAYLNGTLVASANAPDTLAWNSAATSPRPDADASQFQDFPLDNLSDFLVSGDNVLAIQGLNASATDADFLIVAQLLATKATLDAGNKRYFSSPTPGSLNGVGTTTIGPLITDGQHKPAEPQDAEDLVVTARVSPTLNGVTNVSLYYRVMFGAEISLTMLDDGLHGDGVAGDGIYGAIVPNTAYTAGQMVRYYFTAKDALNNQSRQPPIGDTNNSSLYYGTVVKDPSLTNQLPVLHWFTQTTIGGGALQRGVSMYWHGEFYDNIKMNTHGQSSGGFPNHSYNVDFNPDHNFKPDANIPRVDDINLLGSYADKAHMRLLLAYQIYNDSGPRAPYHYCVAARMQSNGVFHSIMHITENGDDKYLKRLGRDPNGSLYKMYTDPSVPANAEKKTRRWEDKSDFTTFVAGINSATNRVYLYDNLDISETINFFAAMIITASVDCCHKNFYLYRDSDGDGEWEMLPWDLDLSFGRNWQSGESYWDDRVYPQNGLYVGGTFPLGPNFIFSNPTTRAMYLRRVRTLQDELLQTNGTPAAQLNFEQQIDHWTELMRNDGALDLAKWGTWGMGNGGSGGGGSRIDTTNMICTRTGEPSVPCWRTLQDAAAELKTNYMVRRRAYVFNQFMGAAGIDRINFTNSQPANTVVNFGALDYNPSSGNQSEEYITLVNTNSYAVDISGWKLAGAIEHTFQAGVVIPSGSAPTNTLYVVPDKKAFRHRASGPRGGQGLYIEGPYKGQLSARGETIALIDKTGRTNRTFQYTGIPSGPQQYLRITEIMYHPPKPPAGSLYDAEEFEYIELKNIGPTNQNLAGVRFINGVEFDFTGSAVTTLAPGAHVLVVKNLAAFTSRYGSGLNIAGQFVGVLANEGERIQLIDAVNEEIHDFSYNNSWYPITDGPGASLVVADEAADTGVWDHKAGWRPSAYDFGSPAQNDPAPAPAPVPVVINELLTHTDLPQVDAIELFNPSATDAANISGWFLSDDFATPKKFRVPDNTIIPAGGYLVFYESNSFGVGPNAFAISSQGDETYLFSGNGTNLTGYLQGYEFGAAENGVSFGRYTNSIITVTCVTNSPTDIQCVTNRTVHFVAQSALTLGAANAAPKVGPAVISEINYRPVESTPGVANSIDEFIELANITDKNLPLYDTNHPANTWRLRSAVDFDFPLNITLPPGGHLLVVSFNPTETALFNTFTSRFSVPGNVRVLGPWDGQLDNSGESIRLYRPDAPVTIPGPDFGLVPYILVDQVDYSNHAPWIETADGHGLTLQRLVESAYGNDPVNWVGVAPSAGAPYVAGGTAPSITTQPQNITALSGGTATFTVGVSGTTPFSYLWFFNQTNLVGSNPELTLSLVQDRDEGAYSVFVYNSAGSVVSASAQLNVVHPPSIAQQPFDQRVNEGANATFSVSGNSDAPPLHYQWRRNGVPIANAINSSLTLNNVVSDVDDAIYSVVLTDGLGTITSSDARLTVLLAPQLINPVPRLNLTAVPGENLTLGIQLRGTKPIYVQWRKFTLAGGSQGLIKQATINSNQDFFVISNVSTNAGAVTNSAGIYAIQFTNIVGGSLSTSATNHVAFLTVLLDSNANGIPDSWESQYFGSPTGADRDADPDGDGMSNWAEYTAGTDPTNAASYLKVDSITVPGSALINFRAVAGRTYTVEYTDDLTNPVWARLADVTSRTVDSPVTVTDPAPQPDRYYRLVTPRRP